MEQYQLALAFSPNCLWDDFLTEEDNIQEFFQRLESILFQDYCTIYYSPSSQTDLHTVFDLLGDTLGLSTRFARLLDQNNVQEVDDRDTKINFYAYLGYGATRKIDMPEIKQALAKKFKHTALIEFSTMCASYTYQIIQDVSGDLSLNSFIVLPTYKDFLVHLSNIFPRRFDETYTKAKHYHPSQHDNLQPNLIKRGEEVALLRCSLEDARNMLQVAFHKNGHHEDYLFFYYSEDRNVPVLFYKASRASNDTIFNFHAYHISAKELFDKYNITASELKIHTTYAAHKA